MTLSLTQAAPSMWWVNGEGLATTDNDLNWDVAGEYACLQIVNPPDSDESEDSELNNEERGSNN